MGIEMSIDEINVYCDESCHLENEACKTMVVACLRCPKTEVKKITNKIIELKQKHGIWKYAEIKWTKVSKNKKDFYIDLLNFFFECPSLKFRAIVIPDKSKLDHPAFMQDHNTFYYKTIYNLVDYFLHYDKSYNIYADKKENSYKAREQMKITRDFLQAHCSKKIRMQNITSYQSEIMQLNDFLQGAVCYFNRNLHITSTNIAKKEIIKYIEAKKITLNRTNSNSKFNLLIWRSRIK